MVPSPRICLPGDGRDCCYEKFFAEEGARGRGPLPPPVHPLPHTLERAN